jgi:hypothetical protein
MTDNVKKVTVERHERSVKISQYEQHKKEINFSSLIMRELSIRLCQNDVHFSREKLTPLLAYDSENSDH